MRVVFIRHGKTKGNIERRYIGITDENLSTEGIFELKRMTYPVVDRVISSPLKRCFQTAEIIYGKTAEVYQDFRECDFGDFENKNYEELKNNKYYKDWLESGGELPFPGGESRFVFCERCCRCFEKIIKSNTAESIAFVVHGGTIMAILERYSFEKKSFYDWKINNGDFLIFDVIKEKKIFSLQRVKKVDSAVVKTGFR